MYRLIKKSSKLMLVFLLLIVGCQNTDSGNNDGYPIEGKWVQTNDENPLYLKIVGDSFTQYENYSSDNCYHVDTSEIINKDGNMYTLSQEDGGENETYRFTVDGNTLTTNAGGGLTFESTDVNPSTFDKCSW